MIENINFFLPSWNKDPNIFYQFLIKQIFGKVLTSHIQLVLNIFITSYLFSYLFLTLHCYELTLWLFCHLTLKPIHNQINSNTDFGINLGCSQFLLSHDEDDQDDDCDDKGGGDDDDNGNGDDDDDNADKTSDDVCWSPSLSLHTSLNRAPQKQTTHKGLIVSVTKMILTSCY